VVSTGGCVGVGIRDCELQGSGTLGLDASGCRDVALVNVIISGCSAGATGGDGQVVPILLE